MAINYLQDVKPFENDGKTDIEIATHLSSRTTKAIPCDAAKIILEEAGLVIEDPITLQRSGTLINHYNSLLDGNPMKSLIGWFIAHVFGRGAQISSNTQPRAVQLASVLANLPPALQAVGTDLLNLGGGQPLAGTVEADIITARAEYEAQVLRDNAIQTVNTKVGLAMAAAQAANDQKLTPAQILSAAESAWSA